MVTRLPVVLSHLRPAPCVTETYGTLLEHAYIFPQRLTDGTTGKHFRLDFCLHRVWRKPAGKNVYVN